MRPKPLLSSLPSQYGVPEMLDSESRPALNAAGAAAAAVLDRLREGSKEHAPRVLSEKARAIAEKPMAAPISPIVLAGTVRVVEFLLIVLVGLAVFAVYIEPIQPQFPRYLAAVVTVATLSTLAFQVADIYQVHAFRGHEKQYMRLASAKTNKNMIVIGASFFLKAGEMFS